MLAFVDVDVDRLKALKDAHGHAAGDDLLSRVVDTLRDVVRDDERRASPSAWRSCYRTSRWTASSPAPTP